MLMNIINEGHEEHAIESINAAMACGKYVTMNAYAKGQSQDGLLLMRVHIRGQRKSILLPLNIWYIIQLMQYQAGTASEMIPARNAKGQINDAFDETQMQLQMMLQLVRDGREIIWENVKHQSPYQKAVCSLPKGLIQFRLTKDELFSSNRQDLAFLLNQPLPEMAEEGKELEA